jgi:hypothetical protein
MVQAMREARESPFRRHMQRDAGLELLTETRGAETGSEYWRDESGEVMVVAVLAEPVQTRLRKGALQVRRAQHGCRDSAPRRETGVGGGGRRVVQAPNGCIVGVGAKRLKEFLDRQHIGRRDAVHPR